MKNTIKKNIASKKWLIIYSISLVVLFAYVVAGVFTLVYAVNAKNIEALIAGGVILATDLPVVAITLFWLNRRACFILIDGNCIKTKGLFFGFKRVLFNKDVKAIGIAPDGKKIYIASPRLQSDMQGNVLISNNSSNIESLRKFWKGSIYIQGMCDECSEIEAERKFYSADEYLELLERIRRLLHNEGYELINNSCSIDNVVDENGDFAVSCVWHDVRCKKCGTVLHLKYLANDEYGNFYKIEGFDNYKF